MALSSSKPNSNSDPFSVEAPFDTDPGADVVLKSCDGYQFRVRKAILTLVSSIFNDMFSLPQPQDSDSTQSTQDNLPIVLLSETGLVIDTLLRYCYPGQTPDPKRLGPYNIIAIHSAAVKYEMKLIEDALKPLRLECPEFLLFLYTNACDRQSREEVQGYAWDCLRLPLHLIVRLWPSSASNRALQNLASYHQSVFVAVSKYLYDWHMAKGDSAFRVDCICKDESCFSATTWWMENVKRFTLNVVKEGPLYSLCEKDRLSFCSPCFAKAFTRWDKFAEGIKGGTESEAAKVRFEIPW